MVAIAPLPFVGVAVYSRSMAFKAHLMGKKDFCHPLSIKTNDSAGKAKKRIASSYVCSSAIRGAFGGTINSLFLLPKCCVHDKNN